MYEEKFYQLHAAQRQLLRPLNNLKNPTAPLQKKLKTKQNKTKTKTATPDPSLCPTKRLLGLYRLNAYADTFNMAGGLNFGLSLHLHAYFVYANNEGSGESVQSRRFA